MIRRRKTKPALWTLTRKRQPNLKAKRLREYRKAAKAFLVGKVCPVTGQPASQIHHVFGRLGRLLLWQPGWIGVSAYGHDLIHRHPEIARERGWLAEKGNWNRQP